MTNPISKEIAQLTAAAHMFVLDNESSLGYSYVYEQVSKDPDSAWQSDQFNVHDDYADHEGEGLLESMTGLARTVEDSLTRYAEIIKAGAKIHALYGNLNSDDVAQWDMDAFAKLGLAIENGIVVDETTYYFDSMKCQWRSQDEGSIYALDAHWSDNFFPEGYGAEKKSAFSPS